MKSIYYFFVTIILISFITKTIAQQTNLDVEGHAKIRGNLDISHMNDTTSVFIGRNAGLNNDILFARNSFVGYNAGYSQTSLRARCLRIFTGFLNSGNPIKVPVLSTSMRGN